VVLGRRPDGWAGGLLCGAFGPERLARWAAERCWAGGAVAGCQAGLGRCAGRWVGLEGGKGLREIGFRFWDFRDLGKRLQTHRIQI
jgi:hypothetical protein